MKTEPRVAIIILNWNGKKDTFVCLESMRKETYGNKEIVLVDNGSTDDSVEEIRRAFPEVTLLALEKNLGFTGGNNAGIEYAVKKGADYVYLINNDTTVEPDALEKLVEAAEENPEAGLVAPVIHDMDPPCAIWFAGSALSLHHGAAWHDNARQPARTEKPYEVPWVTGCAMLLRAELLGQLGGFDDRYFLSWEDVDLSLRVRDAGRKVMVAPTARIYHKGGQSGKSFHGTVQLLHGAQQLAAGEQTQRAGLPAGAGLHHLQTPEAVPASAVHGAACVATEAGLAGCAGSFAKALRTVRGGLAFMSVVFINCTGETFTPTRSGAISTWTWETCRAARKQGIEPWVITRKTNAEPYQYAEHGAARLPVDTANPRDWDRASAGDPAEEIGVGARAARGVRTARGGGDPGARAGEDAVRSAQRPGDGGASAGLFSEGDHRASVS